METIMSKKLKSKSALDAAPCSPSSETPETDKATLNAIDIDGGGEFDAVHVQVAKRLERERDAAVSVLSAIEEIYTDGCDTYEDWKAMGKLARSFFSRRTHKLMDADLFTPI